jgi:hypothetical protein
MQRQPVRHDCWRRGITLGPRPHRQPGVLVEQQCFLPTWPCVSYRSEALRQPLLSAAQRSLGEPANLLVAPEHGPRTAHRPANERQARLVTETGRSSCAASSARRVPARCRSSRSGFMRCSCPDTGCGRSSRSAGSQGRRPPRGGRLPVCRWSSLGRPRPANRRPSAACGSRRGRAEALPGSGKGCLGCPWSPPAGPEHPVPRPAGSSWRPARRGAADELSALFEIPVTASTAVFRASMSASKASRGHLVVTTLRRGTRAEGIVPMPPVRGIDRKE